GRARDLAGGNFAHAAALECSLDRHDQRGLAGELPARNDDTVIGLGHNSLQWKPRGFHAIKRTKQFVEGTDIEKRSSALACPHLNDALAREETVTALFGNRIVEVCGLHCERTSSAACSRRNVTVPGVAPKSLISI